MYNFALIIVLYLIGRFSLAVQLIVSDGNSARSIKAGDPRHPKRQYKHRTKIDLDRITRHDIREMEDSKDIRVSKLKYPRKVGKRKNRSLKLVSLPRYHKYVTVSRKVEATNPNPLDKKRKNTILSIQKLVK